MLLKVVTPAQLFVERHGREARMTCKVRWWEREARWGVSYCLPKITAWKKTRTTHRRGAALAGSMSRGIEQTASLLSVTYSACPPSVMIPLMFSFWQVTKSPRSHL